MNITMDDNDPQFCAVDAYKDSLDMQYEETISWDDDPHEELTFGPLAPAGHVAIILNGPPGVGKDTLAAMFLATEIGRKYRKMAFKEVLYEETAAYFGLDVEFFKSYATDRERKDICMPDVLLEGYEVTPREMLIHVSEDVVKPERGNDYFGKRAAERAAEAGNFWIITDGGFEEELGALSAYFTTVAIVRLHRSDCSFDGDSRDYVHGPLSFDMLLTRGRANMALLRLEDIVAEVEWQHGGSA